MIFINVDLGNLPHMAEELRPAIERAMKDAIKDLSAMAHAHIVEQVQEKLHSRREPYLNALSMFEDEEGVWTIALDRKAMWIEAGMPEHNMLDDLLKSPKAKTSKDGGKYLIVPFQHNKGPTQQTPAQKTLTDTIKSEMKSRNIPYGKIEVDAGGKPKTGLLHSFDILKDPIKSMKGPGMGKGPVGQVMQGNTGIPFLKGIRVYQKAVEDPKTGKSSVKKAIMTFRVASSKQKGTGAWDHPGLEAMNFLDETADWALAQWDQRIRDKVIDSVSGAL